MKSWIFTAENPWSHRTFPIVEFKVASLDRYFENVRYQIADGAKSNICSPECTGLRYKGDQRETLAVGGNTIVGKDRIDYAIVDVCACEFFSQWEIICRTIDWNNWLNLIETIPAIRDSVLQLFFAEKRIQKYSLAIV